MPNANYRAGRRFEYAVMEDWRNQGYSTIRAAGSHGAYDLIAFRPDRVPEFVQCKVVTSEAALKRLVKKFIDTTIPTDKYHQAITIHIKGTSNSSFTYTM